MGKPYTPVDSCSISGNEILVYGDDGQTYAGRWVRGFFASGEQYPVGYYEQNGDVKLVGLDHDDLFKTTVLYGMDDAGIKAQLHNLAVYSSVVDYSMCYLLGGKSYSKNIIRSLPTNIAEKSTLLTLDSDTNMVDFISEVITSIEKSQFVFIECDSLLHKGNVRARARRLLNRLVDVLYHQRLNQRDSNNLILAIDPIDFFLDKYTDLRAMMNDLSSVGIGRVFHVEYPQQRIDTHYNVLSSANASIVFNVGSPGNAERITEYRSMETPKNLIELDPYECVMYRNRTTYNKLNGFAQFPPARSIDKVNEILNS